jgi:hypothetical protein
MTIQLLFETQASLCCGLPGCPLLSTRLLAAVATHFCWTLSLSSPLDLLFIDCCMCRGAMKMHIRTACFLVWNKNRKVLQRTSRIAECCKHRDLWTTALHYWMGSCGRLHRLQVVLKRAAASASASPAPTNYCLSSHSFTATVPPCKRPSLSASRRPAAPPPNSSPETARARRPGTATTRRRPRRRPAASARARGS